MFPRLKTLSKKSGPYFSDIMPLIKCNERFFGRFLDADSPKIKLSEISLKKYVKKMLLKVCRINHKNTLFAHFETV